MDSSTTLKVGAECMGACPKDDPDEILSVPPGFPPVMTFALKRMQENAVTSGCASDSKQTHMDAQCSPIGNEKFKKSLRNRRCVDYSRFDNSSDDEESDYERFEQDIPVIRCLPKGVIRGCTECRNCQKVTARWHPEDSCRPNLDEAPVFYPTEEEFKDTLKYIASIRPSAEPFGICRIIPPPSWTSSCPLKEKDVWENSKFATRIQRVDKLQNRDSMKKNCKTRGNTMRKRRKLLKTGQECRSTNGNPMQTNELANYNNAERFGFEPGPDFTLESFQKYADEFREQYFQRENMDSRQWELSVENIEGEYWRIIEKPTEQIEVLYGADLDTGAFGSGFPKDSSTLTNYDIEDQLAKSGWNLNNLPRLPGSVLSFESGDISGVLVPWLYIGMCFSSFCWHVEDHHLYSLNYMHWGAPKVWYGVPGKDALKLEAAMKKHLSALFEEQSDLLHNLVTQFSPSILKLEGVPVYRCVQHPGDFVLTFPRAYHSGFNCGFNCAEAVNVAPVDWLPHGQNAVELYRQQERKISISHDKLLLEAARVAARAQWNILFLGNDSLENLRWKGFCGPNGILTKALKGRIEIEKGRRECFSCSSQSRKMDPDFTANIERECFVCHYDLHLSAVGCACSPDRFACLVHAKQLCSCAWSTRFFLFRYEINELNVLADALGDKLSAVHRWGLSDLGLSLSSRVNKEKSQDSKAIKKASLDGAKQMDNTPNNQYKLTSDGRGCSLSQEIKTSTLNPLSEGAREGEKVAITAVNLSCKITDCSILHQQNKSMTCSASKEQCLDGGPLLKSHKKEILEYPRYRDSDLSSPDLLDHEHSRESMRNTNLLQSTSSEQKSISCPVLAANSKPLSNSDNIESKTDENLSSSDVGVTLLRHDEHEGAHRVLSGKEKEDPIVENSEAFARLTKCDDQVISSNTPNDQVLVTPETNASEMNENENDLIPLTEECGNILKLKTPEVKDEEKDGICGGDLSTLSDQLVGPFNQNASHSMNRAGVPITRQPLKLLAIKDMRDCSHTDNGIHQEESLLSGIRKPNDESKEWRSESDTDCHYINRGDSTQTSTSHPQNNADRYNRPQKGPRMAKVVRRLNINVEPLEYGVVFSGKLWSSSQAIFPKGFRSRVRYLSILNPTQMCYYVSEILDAGLLGPLFMVMLEHCPSEVFIHVSATKCWDMVREKLNNEIRRLHSMGQVNLPSLQPPGSVDGLEMFGLSSPAIIKAIEAIDQDHVCMEYWRSKPQVQAPSVPTTSVGDNRPDYKEQDSQNSSSLGGTDVALGSLLEKATLEELHALYSILSNDKAKTKQDVKKFLSNEIESRRN